MSREPSGIPRALWGREVERLKQRWEPAAAPPPLEVTNPEILLAVKEELDYIFNLILSKEVWNMLIKLLSYFKRRRE